MLPSSDHNLFSKICLLKGKLSTEYERITPLESVVSGEKEKILILCYKHITLRRGQCTVKYIHSEVTYHLSVAELLQLTSS